MAENYLKAFFLLKTTGSLLDAIGRSESNGATYILTFEGETGLPSLYMSSRSDSEWLDLEVVDVVKLQYRDENGDIGFIVTALDENTIDISVVNTSVWGYLGGTYIRAESDSSWDEMYISRSEATGFEAVLYQYTDGELTDCQKVRFVAESVLNHDAT